MTLKTFFSWQGPADLRLGPMFPSRSLSPFPTGTPPNTTRTSTPKISSKVQSALNIFGLVLFLTWLSFCFSLPLSAQIQAKPNQDGFKLTVDVDLVGVLATVTTPEGALVSNLKKEDFELYENGKPQDIALFAKQAEQSLRLCILFDSSSSIMTELKTQQEAAIEFLQSILRPSDYASVFQVSEEVNEVVRFTNHPEKLGNAIRAIRPKGGTSLYDAIFLASERLFKTKGRKVIVVISDGTDTTSQVQLKDCLRMAQNSEAVIYALVVQPIKSEPGRNLAGEHSMIYLTEKTGGKFFKVSSPESLLSSYASISEELRTQYYLGYYPNQKGEKEEFRKIEIRVNNPLYRVRHREGYSVPVK
jgi:Ca-activated chloride channel family protein